MRRSLPARSPASRAAKFPYVLLALSLLVTAAVTVTFYRATLERDRASFQNAVQSTEDRIAQRLDTYIAVLFAVRGLFSASDEVTLPEFREFVAELELRKRYPGIQGVGFSRRISPEEEDALVKTLRAQGQERFAVWPAGPRDELHSIVYLEPLDRRNRVAIGYDMFSEPVRRAAMERARDTGLAAATDKVFLVQEIDPEKQAGFLIYVPIYRGGAVPGTVAERRAQLLGFAYSPFRIDDLLFGIFGTEESPRVTFDVFDGPTAEPDSLMKAMPAGSSSEKARFTAVRRLEFAGHEWTLHFRSLPVLEESSGQVLLPWVMGVGLLISGLLFQISRAQARAHQRVAAQAQVLAQMGAREAAARAEAEAANVAKDEFMAMLGHELRNPLAPLLTAIGLMRARANGQPQRELEVIERQARHLVRLVDDLLDVSRITRGKVTLKKAPVRLKDVIGKAVEMASPLLEKQRQRLSISVDPVGVVGDEARLAQVFGNLLNNAAKYTEPGGHIQVHAAREGGEAVVRVKDDGIGIAPELLPHVFDRFVQGKQGLDRSRGGLGLGLTLVRSLVEAHGGTVEARSEGVGKGSEFVVRLAAMDEPLAATAPTAPSSPRRPPARKVLVVDDNIDAAELLAELLRSAGHEVAVAHDGPQALEVATRVRPEVAVLDIGLPVMDGYELAARLKQHGELSLVAVTGYGQPSDLARSREAGFSEHLVKPVDPERLLAAVEAR